MALFIRSRCYLFLTCGCCVVAGQGIAILQQRETEEDIEGGESLLVDSMAPDL
jgi:hypothetical protein